MVSPEDVATGAVGGTPIGAPGLPDVPGLTADEADWAWQEWEAEFGDWAPEPLDLIPWELHEEASAACRSMDTPHDPTAVQRGLTASLLAAGYPGHLVAQLVALSPVLTGGGSASCPAVSAASGVGGEGVSAAGDTPSGPVREGVAEGAAAQQDEVRHGPRPERATDQELVAATEALVVVQRWTDAMLAGVLAELAAVTGEIFLGEKGVASADELSKTGRERWRAKTKSVVANELKVLTGWGIQDCHDRIGFAVASRQLTAVPWAALAVGEVQWNQVRAWWSTCRGMPVEVAVQVATRTFGPDSDRATSARRTRGRSGGGGDAARSSFGETKDTLARLVAALLGEDPDASRRERHAALARRDAVARLDDDGTGELTVMGRSSSVVAALDRIDEIARAVRASGDRRTLAQLRADIAMSLLVHGSITPATGHPDPAPQATDDVARDTLPAGASDVAREALPAGASPQVVPGAAAESPGKSDAQAEPLGRSDGQAEGQLHRSSVMGPDGGVVGAPDDALAAVLEGRPSANLEVIVPLEVLLSSDSVGVGKVVGGGYLSAEEVRELALAAGGVLHRLVTDEVDGRVIERSRAAYPPDQQMRNQVAAADRICRAPACLVPAEKCQFDHVENYVDGETGGPTSEANGQSLYGVHHQLKTWGAWKAVMDSYRNVTWTTLFGRVYATRAFDYRLLTHPWTPGTTGADGQEFGWQSAVGGDAALQDDLIYAALAHRGPKDTLAAPDDEPDPEFIELGRGWLHHQAPIQLRHLTRTGKRRKGAPAGQPTPEDLLRGLAGQAELAETEADPKAELPPF